MPTPTTSPLDLTTLAAVRKYAGVTTSTNDDQLIQDCITALGVDALHMCGRGPSDGSVPTASPFVVPVQYDERYDGNGNSMKFLRNWPIVCIQSVTANGVSVPAGNGDTAPGYFIDSSGKAIDINGGAIPSGRYATAWGAGSYGGSGFPRGKQNIHIVYTAGFDGVPEDLEMWARRVVSLNYKKTQWIGQKSQAMAHGAGTVSFQNWDMSDEDRKVIQYYRRKSVR